MQLEDRGSSVCGRGLRGCHDGAWSWKTGEGSVVEGVLGEMSRQAWRTDAGERKRVIAVP